MLPADLTPAHIVHFQGELETIIQDEALSREGIMERVEAAVTQALRESADGGAFFVSHLLVLCSRENLSQRTRLQELSNQLGTLIDQNNANGEQLRQVENRRAQWAADRGDTVRRLAQRDSARKRAITYLALGVLLGAMGYLDHNYIMTNYPEGFAQLEEGVGRISANAMSFVDKFYRPVGGASILAGLGESAAWFSSRASGEGLNPDQQQV